MKTIITPRVRVARESMREQLEKIKELEVLIAKKRVDESYERILQEAEEELGEQIEDGGQ